MILTVVIAAKDAPEPLLHCCLASFGRLSRAPDIEVIIINSGAVPDKSNGQAAGFGAFRIVQTAPRGIYAAYNRGIDEAAGRYLLFFGVDDIALPGMDQVISRLEDNTRDYDMFAAAAYMQSYGISSPSRWPAAILFRNWCHQGLFYSRRYLLDHPFDLSYPIQADHKANIELLANPRLLIGRSAELVSYFSTGGSSQVSHDIRFRRDLPQIAATNFGRAYQVSVILKQRLADLIKGKPSGRSPRSTTNTENRR